MTRPGSRVTLQEGGRHHGMYRSAGSRDTQVWAPASISLSCLQPAISFSSPPTLLFLPPHGIIKLQFVHSLQCVQFHSREALSVTTIIFGLLPCSIAFNDWNNEPFPLEEMVIPVEPLIKCVSQSVENDHCWKCIIIRYLVLEILFFPINRNQ